MEVADDAWMSLLPDLLLDIFCRLQTTAVIRCACVCKPWRRLIISNASILRPRPDRFNPNLLLGFFHQEEVAMDSWPRRLIVSVATADDTMHSKRLSSLIPAVDQSSSHWIMSSRDGFLLLRFPRGSNQDEVLLRTGSNHDQICLCNPMARDCTFLPLSSIMMEEQCQYSIVTGHVGTRAVRILAMVGMAMSCSADRLTYQVFSCDGDGAGIWGEVQCSEELNNGVPMYTYGRNTVVGSDAVHWLAGPHMSGCRVTCTVGLNIKTGRAWTTELPRQCKFFHTGNTPYALTTSVNGRLSLLQPLPEHDILQVWVLDGDGEAMEWTVQHKILLDVPNHQLGHHIVRSHYLNVVCPRSGILLFVLFNGQQLRINLDSHARQPVQCIGERGAYQYYPYEMDWSTYISNMKNF